ncbi:dienelactone hydrolase endo-1,3,1,4-beta-D-glucanase [Multifurca ochricompacta]|uniref:Dienelactone hydrolase endo-1,3,1,4-beta-D-glucanase n=1 Tax=Multifurca ochricompacta TaxID=376703 RepID=A0AAD4QQ62_9AGAM|nr:dienelactone hydrolase endo-1,3,1,4-beta-D-glucanase [Multifurca ochricompacta]
MLQGIVLPGDPKGSMVGPNYFTPAPTDAKQKTKAIVLLTDIFGLPLPNPRIVADHLAEHIGVDVWVPDFFNGKPPFNVNDLEPLMPDRAGVKFTWANIALLIFKVLPAIPGMIFNRPSIVDARVHEMIKAEKGYEKIGAVGQILLWRFHGRPSGFDDSVNTIVIAHPSTLKPAQIQAIKVPTSWALAEEDMSFKDSDVKTAQDIFNKLNHVEYEFKIWKGTFHGFAVRPNLQVPEVKAGYEGALDQTVAWFKKTL